MSTIKSYLKSKKAFKITFEVSKEAAQGAKDMYLLCEHNGWEPIKMKANTTKKKEGGFSTIIEIKEDGAKQKYQYRFVSVMEDGSEKYDNDWNAEDYVANPFGSENSVFTLDVA